MITNVILDNDDCGYVATLTTLDNRPGITDRCLTRRFVACIPRAGASARRMLLRERLAAGLGPSLGTLPGPMEGVLDLAADIDAIVVTYTGRVPGDLNGPFRLQEARITVPGVWPLDLAAAMRVRNVARVVTKYLPSAEPELAPYTH